MIGFILYIVIGLFLTYYILKSHSYTEQEKISLYTVMALFWPIAIVIFIIALIIGWFNNNGGNGLFA